MPELAGRVALVTGASSGIGEATAREFARQWARVALFARREDRLEAVADGIRREGGQVMVCAGDVTDPGSVQAAVQSVLAQWKRVDLLVNNAGRGLAAPFEAVTVQEFRDLVEVNLVGVLTATQAVLPTMLKQNAGHIFNISSVVGRRGLPFRSAYSATKFGLVGLTECLRQELQGTGVHVSLVYPIFTTSFTTWRSRRSSHGGSGRSSRPSRWPRPSCAAPATRARRSIRIPPPGFSRCSARSHRAWWTG
jgi:NADP-dependent 3-hydroxy acid dehydrogenase YdfG